MVHWAKYLKFTKVSLFLNLHLAFSKLQGKRAYSTGRYKMKI